MTHRFTALALSVATASLFASNAAAEDKPPTFYGGLYTNTWVSETKDTKTYADGTKEVSKSQSRVPLYDNGSRIGVRGSNTLNDKMEMQYRVEVRSPVDGDVKYAGGKETGKGRSFEARDMWIGVKHNDYGTVKAGRLLSPEPYVRYTYTTLPAPYTDGSRGNNSIRWESPVYKEGALKDTQLMVHYVLDEKNSTDSHGTDAVAVYVNHTPKDAKYALGGAYFYADGDKAPHGVKIKDNFRITGKYDITDQYQANFLYQQNRFNDVHYGDTTPAKTESAISIGGQFKQNKDSKNVYFAQANLGKNPAGKPGDTKALIAGVTHSFKSNMDIGMEVGYYQTNHDVPAYTKETKDANGVVTATTDIKSHKSKSETGEVVIYTGFRFWWLVLQKNTLSIGNVFFNGIKRPIFKLSNICDIVVG